MVLHHRLVRFFALSLLGFAVFQAATVHAYSYAGMKWTSGKADYWLDIAGWDPALIIYSDRTWDDAGSPFRFNFVGHNVYRREDGKNTVARYSLSSSALAITYTRYSGSSILETDTVFNMNYGWGCCGEPNLYDVRNVMTHEFGHWLKLNDLYNWFTDRNRTMYYSASPGETKKQTLETDDINGINAIY